MRGFDIGSVLPEKIVVAPGIGCGHFQLMTDTGMLPQQRRASNGAAVFR
jgi:hypothetical protein